MLSSVVQVYFLRQFLCFQIMLQALHWTGLLLFVFILLRLHLPFSTKFIFLLYSYLLTYSYIRCVHCLTTTTTTTSPPTTTPPSTTTTTAQLLRFLFHCNDFYVFLYSFLPWIQEKLSSAFFFFLLIF